uniref:Uncharacterized protein n=1 Tax=Pipistrellus kuhlii TaxID=59472 RepID=A0A7J7VBB0_PIPKU|nr:hypothetical protein mPipKuh1_008486 [Pipistrellus kuhlii]
MIHTVANWSHRPSSPQAQVLTICLPLVAWYPRGQGHSSELAAPTYTAPWADSRKTNLAKFTPSKCSTLIVTDLVAWGLDIPLLDNAMNFSFLAKDKLCLCHEGHVPRADRSGTVYSLVTPDEVPYLLDLHLFLGHVLILACPHEEPSSAVSVDCVLGRVPQSIIDEEDCSLRNTLEASLELWALGCMDDKAQQQRVHLQPAPSPEPIERAKELDLTGQGLHPSSG